MTEFIEQIAEIVASRVTARLGQTETAAAAVAEVPKDDFCLSEAEAAKALKIKESTLAAYRRTGAIDYVMFGRRIVYLPQHLTEFLARHEVRTRSKRIKMVS